MSSPWFEFEVTFTGDETERFQVKGSTLLSAMIALLTDLDDGVLPHDHLEPILGIQFVRWSVSPFEEELKEKVNG